MHIYPYIHIHTYKYTYLYIHTYIEGWSIPQGHCPLYILCGKFETATIKLLVVLRILNDCGIR